MRALLSVSDKRGLAAFATGLRRLGIDIVSTGGTAAALREAGVEAVPVSQVTGFPEILGGRVKTLHPHLHGGILARREPGQLAELERLGIEPLDLVVANLYPFRATVARQGVTLDEALETIDIGGPAMIRAAAKNHPAVLVVVDPGDYERVLQALEARATGGAEDEMAALRRELARKAFAHTAAYDAAIVDFLDRPAAARARRDEGAAVDAEALPATLQLTLERAETLRYGENPHQRGARYRLRGAGARPGFWDGARQLKGLPLSYLNVFDVEAAWQLVHEFQAPAAVVVKHANPCGVALADLLADAYAGALAGDPKSAFGGVVALNRPLDAATAERLMAGPKADVVIAPGYADEALKLLHARRKNMRLLEASPPVPPELELRAVDGGFLVQEADRVRERRAAWRVVTARTPTEAEWRDLELAWLLCAYTKSNAIVLVKDRQAVGIGAGQQSRVDAGELAARKAAGRAAGGACASDAFYPFRDGLDAAAAAGVAAVVQPGGSVRDEEVIAAADEHGLAMVFTGVRHFRH